ncbi:MogA/MoaB family molybdenum cofactor biosynthesis protein [Demequina flava]|uniref:MogA/MoaB family molybdenum cofactor biosynthesis protein n=1 Tax=Demequina flava TaxID=1095025 RepID=UPI00078171B9|nr:MogA/MoaB family molybdenum cofactor biosynthesis protein [Demequina flava]
MPGLPDLSVAVITVSDRRAAGTLPDTAGPVIADALAAEGADVTSRLIPDGIDSVRDVITETVESGCRVVITTGGTGVGPRDVTPEATVGLLAQELPGIPELLRRHGAESTPMAAVSRGLAGVTPAPHRAIIVNLPGSENAAREGIALLIPILGHLVGQVRGGDHA